MKAKIHALPIQALMWRHFASFSICDASSKAQSPESIVVDNVSRNVLEDSLRPYSRFIKDPAQRFYSLKTKWTNEVQFLSDTNEMCTCEAYQQIIGMGETALPFIYYELVTEPDHWFWALKAITCEDPVPKEHRGNLKAMTAHWLVWFGKRFNEGFWASTNAGASASWIPYGNASQCFIESASYYRPGQRFSISPPNQTSTSIK